MNPEEKQKFLKESKKLLKATSKLIENKFKDAPIVGGIKAASNKDPSSKFGFTSRPYQYYGDEIMEIIKIMAAINSTNNIADINKVIKNVMDSY